MPTIKDVARRAGVGIATVSRTLHNSSRLRPETAERVRQAMEELGYRPNTHAQSLASGRSHMLGLVVSDISNPFFPGLVKGFEEVALGNGYDVFAASTNYDPARTALCVQRMIERKLDGVAIMTSEIDPGLTDSFARHKVPLVFLDVGKVGRGVSNVKIDYACGIAQAVGAPPRTGASPHRFHLRAGEPALGVGAARGVPRAAERGEGTAKRTNCSSRKGTTRWTAACRRCCACWRAAPTRRRFSHPTT